MRLYTHIPAFGKATTERRQFAPQSNEKQCSARSRKILSVRYFVPNDRTPNGPNVELIVVFGLLFRCDITIPTAEIPEPLKSR